MSNFDIAIQYVLKNEGDTLSNNPADPGGLSKFGISLRLLKACGDIYNFDGSGVREDTIRDLTIDQAKLIYYNEFWEHAPFEDIGNQIHCNYIFDMAINLGIAPAIKCVQRAIWAVMKQPTFINDDGILGPQTIAAIKMCGFLLMPALRAERAAYYRNIVSHNSNQEDFIKGWINRTYKT